MGNENYILIKDIFNLPSNVDKFSIQSLKAFELNKDFKVQFLEKIGLYHNETNSSDGAVCFSNAPELQTSYRNAYNKNDVICYLLSQYRKLRMNIDLKVSLPINVETFWKKVEEGRKIYREISKWKA